MMARRAKQDTVVYTLRKGRNVVYKGITNDLDRRIKEHKADGKKFTSLTKTRKMSRESAKKCEKQQIKTYKRSKGKPPKYNKKV